ncbi:GIY-YIG nuclease family protein [Melioribacter sp. Ez-97]|uniref:GIY-YIG nuclease family protein n=1 Tax=Melioribacter sp. Ez-97 TaxID=3423434 RepID=UPI003ED9149E
MFYVYVLRSLKDNKRYIGLTANITRRFREHQEGLVKSTRNRRPFELIYFESFENKSDALKREKFFKTGKGREFLNSLSQSVKIILKYLCFLF